jgi:hypothetical protein
MTCGGQFDGTRWSKRKPRTASWATNTGWITVSSGKLQPVSVSAQTLFLTKNTTRTPGHAG